MLALMVLGEFCGYLVASGRRKNHVMAANHGAILFNYCVLVTVYEENEKTQIEILVAFLDFQVIDEFVMKLRQAERY